MDLCLGDLTRFIDTSKCCCCRISLKEGVIQLVPLLRAWAHAQHGLQAHMHHGEPCAVTETRHGMQRCM